ncbi:aminodeoxychorismate synthase component I [Spirosoma luteum]|uniref:aminodeoxychorismate synthase component I n=1 Tax=Spirosoma luteum TaxID=431553 RepID=UPI000364D4F4|nr:aminodeoxychorismate synthase component I [Spirosoma luteum]
MTFDQAIDQMNAYGRQRQPFLFVLDFDLKRPLVLRPNEWKTHDIAFDFSGTPAPASPEPFWFRRYPMPFEQYRIGFDYVVKNIHLGNSFLVNLSGQTPIETNLALADIYARTTARYKLRLANQFVCFSPEPFVQIRGNRLLSFPMKGTIMANLPNAEATILADAKEAAEHATIVDLIRSDLSRIAQKVWVERYRYIDRIDTHEGGLLQVSSEIAALLPDNWRDQPGTLLASLLPAGSISGAPKPKTIKLIHRAEQYDRGYYTGVCGYFDGEHLDSGVMIRFIENQQGQLVFKSGGGITARSNAWSEYQELIDKVYLPVAVEVDSSIKSPVKSSFIQ